jgi:hypothetical protein
MFVFQGGQICLSIREIFIRGANKWREKVERAGVEPMEKSSPTFACNIWKVKVFF